MSATHQTAYSNGIDGPESPHRVEKGSYNHVDNHPPAGYQSQPGFPVYSHRKFANPAPLGLFSFASTTLMLSLYNCNARGVMHPNVVVGMAIAVGGLAQLLAGMWEFATGNTFGATAFSSYGCFWISYACILIPGTGIIAAYEGDAEMLGNALAIFLMVWFVFTFIMWIASMRSSVGLCSLFLFLWMTFLVLMVADFKQSATIRKAGGGLGIATAFIAYYVGAAGLFTHETSYVRLPVIDLPKHQAEKV
ncbi:hypothetical protein FRC03_012497 [Tulasnella sp. 419]|nr:hypothetical protein FRC02_000531 [Tulasnella sp. 418]KAG8951533.1 hypothetical protein FRC03_012497 [Tulasnella sp. 419]